MVREEKSSQVEEGTCCPAHSTGGSAHSGNHLVGDSSGEGGSRVQEIRCFLGGNPFRGLGKSYLCPGLGLLGHFPCREDYLQTLPWSGMLGGRPIFHFLTGELGTGSQPVNS